MSRRTNWLEGERVHAAQRLQPGAASSGTPRVASLTGRCLGLIADLLVGSVRPAIDGIRRQVGVTLIVKSELTDHGVELALVKRLDHAPHVGSAGRLRRLCPGL